mmetsp:Transcript_36831/g.92992  ORF Transcript_36831/g.92992 Transcript_36831/m.92992 type:complete len:201 (+) Transcript_36831:127-729(+)
MSRMVPALYSATHEAAPQSKMLAASAPSTSASHSAYGPPPGAAPLMPGATASPGAPDVPGVGGAATRIASSSASRSGSTAMAAAFSRSLSRLYTSANPNSRRHSSRISNSSATPSAPYAPGSARSLDMCAANALPNAAARRLDSSLPPSLAAALSTTVGRLPSSTPSHHRHSPSSRATSSVLGSYVAASASSGNTSEEGE